ncbi:tetratricopeptide repeat protein [Methanosarcina sp. T3]|uniref:tetratricopeptide repeat protein n=1 Tax=Methanosarcina sp. T3 TaxID=3439062 RepID=UPI003F86AE35
MGITYYQLENYFEAHTAFSNAVKVSPILYIEAKNYIGLTFIAIGEHEKAINCFDEVIQKLEKLPKESNDRNAMENLLNARIYRSTALEVLEKYEEAINTLKLVFEEEKSENKNILSRIEFTPKGLDRYKKSLDKSVCDMANREKKADSLNKIGLALLNMQTSSVSGDQLREAAKFTFEKALEYDNGNSQIWYNKGVTHSSLKKDKEAMKAFNNAIVLDPRSSLAWYKKALLYHKLGENKKSRETFEDFIHSSYESKNKDLEHLFLNKYKNVIEAIDNINIRSSKSKKREDFTLFSAQDAKFLHDKGLEHFFLKEYKDAIEAFEKALKLNENYTSALKFRGLAYCYLRENEKALDSFEQAIKIYDKYSGICKSLKDESSEDIADILCFKALILKRNEKYKPKIKEEMYKKSLEQSIRTLQNIKNSSHSHQKYNFSLSVFKKIGIIQE